MKPRDIPNLRPEDERFRTFLRASCSAMNSLRVRRRLSKVVSDVISFEDVIPGSSVFNFDEPEIIVID